MTTARISHNDGQHADTGGRSRFGSQLRQGLKNRIVLSNGLDGVGEVRDNFARNLKFWLQERGINGSELARLLDARGLGVGKGAVSHWLNSRTEPDLETLKAMGAILSVSATDLLDSGEAMLNQIAKRQGLKVRIEPKKN